MRRARGGVCSWESPYVGAFVAMGSEALRQRYGVFWASVPSRILVRLGSLGRDPCVSLSREVRRGHGVPNLSNVDITGRTSRWMAGMTCPRRAINEEGGIVTDMGLGEA